MYKTIGLTIHASTETVYLFCHLILRPCMENWVVCPFLYNWPVIEINNKHKKKSSKLLTLELSLYVNAFMSKLVTSALSSPTQLDKDCYPIQKEA